MTVTTGWEFLLNGNPQNLRQLTSGYQTLCFQIYGGVDHWLDCPNDDFRMKSVYCGDDEDDESVMWQVGYELVSLFNGATRLISRDARKVSISRLLKAGVPINYQAPAGVSGLLGAPPISAEQKENDFRDCLQGYVQFPLLRLAAENEDVYMILKYLDMELNWSTYYKLMEAIETFAKVKGIDLETSKTRRTTFTNTANNFSLSGFDSRHGFKEAAKQNRTASMSVEDAYEFTTSMAKIFLGKAYLNQYRLKGQPERVAPKQTSKG